MQDYSSGEDDTPTNDVFSLSSLRATKKIRVEEETGSMPVPNAAPDVLSEVRRIIACRSIFAVF
jgi:hypothetical protein